MGKELGVHLLRGWNKFLQWRTRHVACRGGEGDDDSYFSWEHRMLYFSLLTLFFCYDESKPKSLSLASSWMNKVRRDDRFEPRFEFRCEAVDPLWDVWLRPDFAGLRSNAKSSDDGSCPLAFLRFCWLGPLSTGAKKNSTINSIGLLVIPWDAAIFPL